MTFTLMMLALFPIGLITAAILLCRLPDEQADLATIQQVNDQRRTREAGEQR